MKILITGGSGFVGRAVAGRLAAHELVLPSRNPVGLAPAGPGASPLFTGELEKLVREIRPEIIINLLGIIRETPAASFRLVHEDYPRRLLAGAKAAGVRKFIQMSALGAAPDAPSEYHRSKFAGEELVRASGLPFVIFRPSYISGPGQALRADLKRLARFFPVFAAPCDALAAPLDVGTVAECFAAAAEDEGVRNEVFELAGEKTVSFRDLLASELAAAGLRRPVLGLPRKLFFPALPLFALFDPPPMTYEQYLMLASPNVPSGKFRGADALRKAGRKEAQEVPCRP